MGVIVFVAAALDGWGVFLGVVGCLVGGNGFGVRGVVNMVRFGGWKVGGSLGIVGPGGGGGGEGLGGGGRGGWVGGGGGGGGVGGALLKQACPMPLKPLLNIAWRTSEGSRDDAGAMVSHRSRVRRCWRPLVTSAGRR